MMLKCKDVSHLVASGDVAELGFMKRLELRVHLAMCRHCAAYVRQIHALGNGIRNLTGASEPSSDELQQLENHICEHRSHHRGDAG